MRWEWQALKRVSVMDTVSSDSDPASSELCRTFAYHGLCFLVHHVNMARFSAVQQIKPMLLRCTHTVNMWVSNMLRGCLRCLRPYCCMPGRIHLPVPTVDHNSGHAKRGGGRLHLSNWQVSMTRRVGETVSLLGFIFVYGKALWPKMGLRSSEVCS